MSELVETLVVWICVDQYDDEMTLRGSSDTCAFFDPDGREGGHGPNCGELRLVPPDVLVFKDRADLVSALRAEGMLVVEKDPDRQDWPSWAFDAMGVQRFGSTIERSYRGLLLDALAEAQVHD